MKRFHMLQTACFVLISVVFTCNSCSRYNPDSEAETILNTSGIKGGLIVHIGCGNGSLTTALRKNDSFLVHGLDRNGRAVDTARSFIRSKNLYGDVSIDYLKGNNLPYIDNLVNLVVAEKQNDIAMDEIMRVLCPGGVACIKKGSSWEKFVKPHPEDIDEWTHYLYNPTGNPVSHDLKTGPPEHFQWIGGPKWTRHHDHMSGMSALVTASGRIFYIIDEGSTASILLPSRWKLIARDAYNGTVLWKQPIDRWHTHLWPLKSGPAQLPRRLVAVGDKVYVTLGIDAPVSALDAATGEILTTYEDTQGTEEILLSDDNILYLLVDTTPEKPEYKTIKDIRKYYNEEFWTGEKRMVAAIDAESGETLWTSERTVLPVTLTLADGRLFFHNGNNVICLDRHNGKQLWGSKPIARSEIMRSFYAPLLVAYKGVVIFAGGERAGLQGGEWYEEGEDTMTALSAETGEVLWSAYHPPSGYRSMEDIFIIDDTVWAGENTSGEVAGEFNGRHYKTGEVMKSFVPDVDTYWFHHRCYRSKATERFLMTSRNGIEYIDPKTGHWDFNHWVRGACLYGIMPANGLVYAPPNPCACYPEAKLSGFCALAPTSNTWDLSPGLSADERLEKGPAYGKPVEFSDSPVVGDWPTYRHDSERSGSTGMQIPANISRSWETKLGGTLSSLVAAEGKVFGAQVDKHTVFALDENSGNILWTFTAGGRVDSPPTIDKGRVLFGSADGSVYCLRATDGVLIWCFLAAQRDMRMCVFGQVESVWPVHGNVLVRDGVAWFVAGRSMFVDNGMFMYKLDAETGKQITVTPLRDTDPESGEFLHKAHFLTMPVALPDILSADDRFVYMRSQRFDREGKRIDIDPMGSDPFYKLFHQNKKDLQWIYSSNHNLFLSETHRDDYGAHLFCPTGFLDDTSFHRTYWTYGKHFLGGFSGYPMAGKYMPAGKILVHDEDTVYAFGRFPHYYRWTTPLEHHLYATDKVSKIGTETINEGRNKGRLKPAKGLDYNWAGSVPLLVRSMLLADKVLFFAGPPDVLDEEDVLHQLTDPEVRTKLLAQEKSLEGKSGALFYAASAETGEKLAEYRLDVPPVWDGMAASSGKLYMALTNGNVICYDKTE